MKIEEKLRIDLSFDATKRFVEFVLNISNES